MFLCMTIIQLPSTGDHKQREDNYSGGDICCNKSFFLGEEGYEVKFVKGYKLQSKAQVS